MKPRTPEAPLQEDPFRSRLENLISTRNHWRCTRLRRRSVIEALIGHMKVDGLMGRNCLKGPASDTIHAILCAAGQSLRLLVRAIADYLVPRYPDLPGMVRVVPIAQIISTARPRS
jgi:hypothetical protein